MKFYIDQKMIFIDNNGHTNIYTPHSHNTLKINQNVAKILKQLISIGSGVEFHSNDLLKIFDKKYTLEDISPVLNKLIQCNFLFESEDDYLKNSFYNKAKNAKKFDLSLAYLHVTQKCNLNCSYCYNKQNLNNSKVELTTEQWIETIDKLASNGVSSFIITGGEPLIRKDLIDILKHINKLGLKASLLTNGTLLNKNHDILELLDTVTVSLDSIDNSINDSNRENSKHYNIIDNLRNIPPIFKEKFTIRSVITNNNIDNIDAIKHFVEDELKMNHILALFAPNSEEEVALIPDYTPYLSKLRGPESMEFNNGLISCGGCFNELAIDSNGDIYPCQALIKQDLRIGNVLSPTWLDDLKNSNITCGFMDRDVKKISECTECSFRYICGGGCRAIAYNVYGNLNAHLKCYCDYLKKNSHSILLNTMFK